MSSPNNAAESLHHREPGDGLVARVPYLLMAIILVVIALELATDSGERGEHQGRVPLRGVALSLVVIAVIVTAAVRRQPIPLGRLSTRARAAMEVRLVEWFLWMRSLACATATVLILITADVARLLPIETLLPLLLCVLSLAVSNIVFQILLRRFPSRVNGQIWGQVICDLALLSLMLHFSGGIENPLSLLFLFHVIIAGILFSRVRCYLVGLVAFSFFVALVVSELRGWSTHYTLQIFPHGHLESSDHAAHYGPYVYSRILLQALLLLTTAYFITTIMDRLRNREEELIELAEKETEARERLESVVDAAGVGLRLLDSDLRPVWTNARFLAWATDEEPVLRNADKTLADGCSRLAEHELLSEDGRRQSYRTTTAAMNRADGSAHQVVLLIQDITAEKRAETELLFAGKLAAVGELAGNISHEINNPLGVLSARLHLLLSRHADSLSESVSQEVHKMTEMADRITTITRALLDYCRPGPSERKPVPVAPIVERARDVVESRTADPEIHIEVEIDPDLPLVNVDSGELEQVLVNLLMNAVDASPPSSKVTLEVGAVPSTTRRAGVRIVVQDSGPGVAEALRGRVFEPFFTTKKAGKGTGLGLSICHRIIASHGGTIVVGSAPDSGARFQIDLPAHTD